MSRQDPEADVKTSAFGQPVSDDAERLRPGADEWAPGTRIGNYRIEALLGRGGMGEVYQATQLRPVQRQVAIKRLPARRLTSSGQAWFEVERQLLAQMQHPCIAQFFDADTLPAGSPYLVMELIDGVPLIDFCTEQRLPLARRIGLFVHLLDGVQHAHQRGVIHRDLKPSNILVARINDRPRPKIIDFGIATAAGEDHVRALGTRDYMSPEQASPQAGGLDTRSDIYSLGAILHEMLTHRLPQADPSRHDGLMVRPSAVVERLLEDERRELADSLGTTPTALVRQLREELDWILLRAMAPQRDDRYGSAAAFADDLQSYRDGRPTRAHPGGRAYRLRAFVRRNRLPVTAFAAALVALVAGLGMALFGLREAAVQRQAAEDRQAELEQVVAFQQEMLADVDLDQMGQAILRTERELAERSPSLRALDEETRAATLRLLEMVDGTDLARSVLDEQILARSMATIDREFAEQPLLAAQLRESVAYLYNELGLAERSLELYDQVLSVRRQQLGGEHRDTLEAELGRVSSLLNLGRPEEVREAATALEAKAVESLGPDDSLTLDAGENVVQSLLQVGDYHAVGPVVDALAPRADAIRRFRLRTLQCISLMRLAQRKDAKELMQQQLDEVPDLESLDDPAWLPALGSAVGILASGGDPEAAIVLADRLVETSKALLGSEHPNTLVQLHNRSATLIGLQRFPEAVAGLRNVIEVRTRVLGERHPQTLRSVATLAAALTRWNLADPDLPNRDELFDEAIEQQRRVVIAREDLLGPDHPETLLAHVSLGGILEDYERFEEAKQEIGPTLDRYVRTLGASARISVDIRSLYAGILVALGEIDDARREYATCVELATEAFGADDPLTEKVASRLAALDEAG